MIVLVFVGGILDFECSSKFSLVIHCFSTAVGLGISFLKIECGRLVRNAVDGDGMREFGDFYFILHTPKFVFLLGAELRGNDQFVCFL